MHSIRTRFTFLTVCAIVVALSIATLISGLSIKNIGENYADQMLHLMCTTGAMNLETYRADKRMYENKRQRKEQEKNG